MPVSLHTKPISGPEPLLRAIAVALLLTSALAAGCSALPEPVAAVLPGADAAEPDPRLEAVLAYFRAQVDDDYEAMAEAVVAEARPFLATPGLEPKRTSAPGRIAGEEWNPDGSVTITLDYPSGISAYSTLLAPESSTTRTIRFENSNDNGLSYSGTVNVTIEDGRWVVEAIDGMPILEVLKREHTMP